MRTWEMRIHFFMISLRPFRHIQVSSKFFRRLSTSGDLTLKGWQRVHHSTSSIRERWHWSQSTSFHIRGVRVSIWISREILRGLMNIMIRRIMLIFIALSSSLRNRVVSTMMFIWGLWSFWGIWSMWGIWSIWGLGSIWRIWFIWRIWSGVPILQRWCHEDIHLNTFKALFGNPDFLHRGTVPASKYFTILIFEQFIVGVKWLIRRMRRFTCKAR